MRFLNKTYLRFFLAAALLMLTLSNDLIAQGCVSTSPYSWLWPSHKNWFIAPPNLWNGQVINMATGAQTSVGTGGAPAIQQYEGTSCASDDNGNLLFFTNGRRLFKGTGASVTNPYSGLLEGNEGGATGTNGSAAQGVITVRHPLNPTKYYIFTTDDANGGTTLGFNYFVFNSSGTNVAPTGANRLGSFRACEGIAATKHANGVDIWITCLESGTGKLNSYLLTCTGLTTTPVVSAVGPVVSGQQERGGVAFSVDGTHFATGFSTVVTAYKFDNSTGVMSDKHTITGASPSDAPYDIIFSPDGSKIYYTQQNGNLMYINISGWPSAAAMITSRASTGIATLINSIEFAADGFLYMSTNRNGGPIAKISGNYNAATGLSAANVSGTVAAAGLPSMYLPPQEEPDIHEVGPYCAGDPAVDLVTTWLCAGSSAEDATNYPTEYAGNGITNTGTGIFNPTTAGVGTHRIIFTRCSVDDTIWIRVNTCSCPDTSLSNIPSQCSSGGAVSLNSYKVTTEAGTWSIQSAPGGSTASISGGNTFNISNTVAGSYVVRFTLTTPQSGCPDYAERTIVIYTKPNISLTNTTICSSDAAATFDAGSGYTTYAWSGNGTGSSRTTTGTTAGTYTVRVVDANGCKDTSSATLTVNTKPNVTLTNATICSGDAAATFDAGSGYTTYAWSGNGTGSSRTTTGTTAGTYTVRVVDANGCKDTSSATLTVNTKPNVVLTNASICSGNVAATFDAGSGYTTYAWSGNGTGSSRTTTGTTAGTYTVRVVDANGCKDTASAALTVNAKPNVTLTNVAICSGDPAATFDAGAGYTTYAWSGNGTGTSRATTGATAGTYTVIVTDANGCKDTSSATLTVNAKPNITPPSATICSGDAVVTFDAGSGYTTYAWSGPATGSSQTISATIAGIYQVIVTAGSGCKDTATATLTVNSKPNVTLTNATICEGDAAATFDAGAGYTSYNWIDNGTGTSRTASGVAAGAYTVQVVDANGCKDTASASLTVNAKPNVTLANATICSGDAAVSFDAGAGYTTYAWSGNGTGASRTTTGTAAGTYTVRVVDANGCKDTSSATLTVNAKPNLTLTNATICSGDAAATFDAGSGYTTYAWSANGTGSSRTTTGIIAGTYTVRVVDANGCKDTASATLTVNILPIVNLGNDVEVCFDSQAAIFDAGNAGSSYLWSNSSTAKTITTATSNTYSVEVTNTNGCKGRDTVELIINALPTVDLGADRSICSGSNTTFDAGAGFTFYLWQNNTTNQTLNTGAAGDYSVTVIDDKGCSDSDTAKVIVSTNLTVALGADKSICVGEPAVTFNAGNTGATFLWSDGSNAQTLTTATAGTYTVVLTDGSGCAGKDTVKLTVNQLPIVTLSNAEICQGSAGAVFTPGTFASYKWSSGETSASITKNVAGTYKVTVMDGKGCKDSVSADLTINPLPIFSLGSDRSICPGTSTTFDAGTFASYLWNDNSTLQTKTATSGGNVIVEVIDSKGCKAKDTAIVSVKNSLTINLGPDKAICAGDAAVTFDAALAGMNYLWSNAETSQTITTAAAGTYIVNVDDGSGCAGKDTVKLIVNNLPVVNLGADKSICSGDPMVTFDAAAGYASYGWSNNSAVRNITVGAAGVYSVEVTDNNGCIAKDTVELIVNNLPVVDLGADRSICPGTSTTFDAGSFATYAWNNSTTYQTNAVSNQGNVIVNITDAKGCKDADTAYVTVSNNLTVLLGNDKEICFGDAAITFDAGIAGATYSWNSGESTQTVSTDVAGSYAVTVATPDGCTGTDVVTLKVNPLPTVTIANQTICAGDTATFNAGNFAAYSWLSGENTASISKTTAGTYTVQVTDGKGCKNASSATLSINALPTVTLSNEDVCTGLSATFDAGTGFSSYAWSSGETSQSISKSLAGTYTVRVKDANNCKVSASATLVINAPPNVTLPAFAPRCLNDQPFKMNGGMPAGGQYKTIYNSLVMAIDTFQVKMMGAGSHQVMYEYTDNKGCKNIASSNVVVNNMPTLSIADKTVCAGESATFDAGPGFSLYYWNTAANTRTMATSTGGKYIVNVTNAQGCKSSDTVELIVNANPQVDLGADKKACEGSNFTLTSNVTASSYLWNNNATSNSIVVNTSGKYSLTVTDINGCKGSDDIQVSIIARPLVDLGADKQICAGSSVTLNINLDASASVYWSTGAKDKAITVNRTGAYMVQAYYDPTCPSFDTINVIVVPRPISTLGNDTIVCFNETGALTLEAGAADEFLWNDKAQSTTSSIDVQQEGTYIVQLTNANLCSVKDTISINQICVTSVYIPNAFSPNGDATNDVFYVKGLNVEKFHLMIFNRWGELIFESYDINNGWDGTYMGNEVQISAYVWKVDWLSTNSQEQKTKNERTGTVSLIR